MEDWLYAEAALLDDGRFEEWLALFDAGTRYWAPVRVNAARGQEGFGEPHRLTHFDDDKATLGLRVARLGTGFAHAEEPPSRQRHHVSNVRILKDEGGSRVQVASNLLVFRSREARQEVLFSCARRDWWRREGDGWLNEERMVVFDHDVIESLSIFF
jgi:3-phenylpropionate/cinnamic acid dioxygenase small subunit